MVSTSPGPREEARCRILVVDDHPLAREAMRLIIRDLSSLDSPAICEAESGEDGIAHASMCRPDVILMDIGLPGISGLEAARKIRDELPSAAIVMVTAIEEPGQREVATQFGAAGFVLKDQMAKELPSLLSQLATRPEAAGWQGVP